MTQLLEGTTVLDLGRMHAGPYCGRLFAGAGADVIHVEHPSGDPARTASEAAFAFLNAGKRSVTLDYTTPNGAGLLWELVDRADILIENSMPGTLERHGFGTEALLRRNPALVRVSITNFGQTGPYRDLPATELTVQAAAGIMDTNGAADREPLRYPMNVAQHWAGANGAQAALIAHWHALQTGHGQHVDVSIQESLAMTWYLQYAEYEYNGSVLPRGQNDLLWAADGAILANQTSVTWEEYALTFDAVELAVDTDYSPLGPKAVEGKAILREHIREKTRAEWFASCIAHGVPAGMLQSLDEILACPQHAARRYFDSLRTPGGKTVPVPGPYYLINEARMPRTVAAPALGEHNGEVYMDMLGHTPDQLAGWAREGAIS